MLKLNKYLHELQKDMIGTSQEVEIYSIPQFKRYIGDFINKHNFHTPNIGLFERNWFLFFVAFHRKEKMLNEFPDPHKKQLSPDVIEYLKEFVDNGYSDSFDGLYSKIGVKEICQIEFDDLKGYENIINLIGESFHFVGGFYNYEISEKLFNKMNNGEIPDLLVKMILTKLPTTQYSGHEQHMFMQVLFDNRDNLNSNIRHYLNTVSVDIFKYNYDFDLGLILGQKMKVAKKCNKSKLPFTRELYRPERIISRITCL